MIPCPNSAKSCGDPHCVQHRGAKAIPMPPEEPSRADVDPDVRASAQRMIVKHRRSLETLGDD